MLTIELIHPSSVQAVVCFLADVLRNIAVVDGYLGRRAGEGVDAANDQGASCAHQILGYCTHTLL
jgi:hypothetical protein